ncbi:MAG TPA: hypothetical protein VNW29_00845 [Candidatus Sulfotelmatobacter sp.]|jgi:F0F1-type ATP synthase epsilon subunit|nr:hypothetical protein [Candidatus Sulfotelmatobacter sp.]
MTDIPSIQQQSQPQVQKHQPVQVKVPVPDRIHLTVRNRTKILFDDNVRSISSKNDTGIFDILPEHTNFISLITSPLIVRKLDRTKYEIHFTNGIIKVKDNAVHCYIDLLANKKGE